MYIGVYTIPIDPMGYNDLCLRNYFASLDVNFYELKTYQAYIYALRSLAVEGLQWTSLSGGLNKGLIENLIL